MAKMNMNIGNKWVEVYGTIILIRRQTVFHRSFPIYPLQAILNQHAHKIHMKLNHELLQFELCVCGSGFDFQQIFSDGTIQLT